MMSKTDIFFNKVLKTSLLIATIAFVLLVLDLFFALINQALDCSSSLCVIDADQPFFRTSLVILVVLVVLFVIVARTILLFLLRQTELTDANIYRQKIAELVETGEEFSKSQLYEEIQKIKSLQQEKEQEVVEPNVEKGQLSFEDLKFEEQEEEEVVEIPIKTKKKTKPHTVVVVPEVKEEVVKQEEPKVVVKEIKEKKDKTEVELLQDRIKSILNKVSSDSEDEIYEDIEIVEEKVVEEEIIEEDFEDELIEEEVVEEVIKVVVKPVIEKVKVPKKIEEKPAVKAVSSGVEVKRTKIDIIEYIEKNTELSKNKGNIFLKYFAEVVKEELSKENDVVIPGFGTFTIIEMPAKDAVNPQTNEAMIVPAHKQARLRFDSEFKDKF